MTDKTWFRSLSIIAASVATSLQPVYGKDKWYIAVSAVAYALALVAPSAIKPTSSGGSGSA